MNKKLHILFLSGWYPSRVSPSNGDFVQRHAEAVATKHEVTLIHIVTDSNILSIEQTNEVIKCVKTTIIYTPRYKNLFLKWWVFIKLYLSEIKKIKNFDLIHLNITYPVGVITLYFKLFKRKPYIISEHWTGYQVNLNQSIGTFEKFITKLIIKNASFVCPVSKNLQNQMINFGLKGVYFPVQNVVNTDLFKPRKIDLDSFTITHISHMRNEHKNVEGIILAISRVQNKIKGLKFNLIGDQSFKYRSLIDKLGIKNINIIDQISHKDVPKFLNESNLFILFSNYENLPCVIIEAFASGVPVISTKVGGIEEFFPKEFGYLIEPKDTQPLENSILKIYNGALCPDKKIMHNYTKKNFSYSAVCSIFSKLYSKSLNEK